MENLNIFVHGIIFISFLFLMRKMGWKLMLNFFIKTAKILPNRFKTIPSHISLLIFSSVFLIATISISPSVLYFGIIIFSFIIISNLTLKKSTN